MTKLGQGGGLARGWGTKKAARKKPSGISQKQIDKIMRSPKVKAGTRKKAQEVQYFWTDIAPVFGDRPEKRKAPTFGHVGSYRDSIVVQDTSDDSGANFRVIALDWKARMIEFGNAHMPKYAPLAKVKAKFRK